MARGLGESLRAVEVCLRSYFTRMNIVAKVYSAIDSISTNAKIKAKRMAAVAPGFRAMPSHAAAVAFD